MRHHSFLLLCVQHCLDLNSPDPGVGELLKLVCKAFYSATYMGVPPYLLRPHPFAQWMTCFHTLLLRPVPKVSSALWGACLCSFAETQPTFLSRWQGSGCPSLCRSDQCPAEQRPLIKLHGAAVPGRLSVSCGSAPQLCVQGIFVARYGTAAHLLHVLLKSSLTSTPQASMNEFEATLMACPTLCSKVHLGRAPDMICSGSGAAPFGHIVSIKVCHRRCRMSNCGQGQNPVFMDWVVSRNDTGKAMPCARGATQVLDKSINGCCSPALTQHTF